MAKAPKRPKRPKVAKAEEPTQIALKVVMDVSEGTTTYYANYADVGRSEHDIAITFGRTPAKVSMAAIEEATRTGILTIEGEFQVILPPSLIPGLLTALTTQFEGYEKLMGKVPKRIEEQ